MRLSKPLALTLVAATLAACQTHVDGGRGVVAPLDTAFGSPAPTGMPSSWEASQVPLEVSAEPTGPVPSAPGVTGTGVDLPPGELRFGDWLRERAWVVSVGEELQLPAMLNGDPVRVALADPASSLARLEGGPAPQAPSPSPLPSGAATPEALPPLPAMPSEGTPPPVPMLPPPPNHRLVALAPGAVRLTITHQGQVAHVHVALMDPALGNTFPNNPYGQRWPLLDAPTLARDQATVDRLWQAGWGGTPMAFGLLQAPQPSAPGGLATSIPAPTGGPTSAPPPPEGPRVAFPARQLLLVPVAAGEERPTLVRVEGSTVFAVAPRHFVVDGPAPTQYCAAEPGGPWPSLPESRAPRTTAYVLPALPAGPVTFTLLPFPEWDAAPHPSPTPCRHPRP